MARAGHRPGRRTGRRPGTSGTRSAILDAAREAFGTHGYERATIRGIAERAGVDPALVHHYFGSKQELFVAAMQLPVDPVRVVERLLDGERERVGERIAGTFLTVWDAAANRGVLLGLIRSALSDDTAARMLREFVTIEIIGRVARSLGVPDPALRGNLVASQLLGLAVARYIVRLEPLASTPPHLLAAAVGPTLQRYLTGALTLAERRATG